METIPLIKVDKDKCVSCSLCVEACPFGLIEMDGDYPKIDDGCRLCGACSEACPEDAILIKEKEKDELVSDYKGVLIYAEQHEGKVHPVAYELLGKGGDLAGELGEPLYAVIIGRGLDEAAKDLAARGPDRIFVYDDPALTHFRDDPYAGLLKELAMEVKPNIFLIGATSIGRSLGPKVASSLETGLTADCTGLEIDPDSRLLLQTRPAYGGNIMATIICPERRPQMATVRYKVMKEAKIDPRKICEIIEKPVDLNRLEDRVKTLGFQPSSEELSIVEADLIVSGGKGLGEAKGFKLISELSQVMGGAVGASRPTVDEGWIGYSHQVGLSGRTVRPKLYLACGISGSVQHLAGMKTSETIISINKDPNAPILKISSLGVIGDLYQVIPILIEKIREFKGNG